MQVIDDNLPVFLMIENTIITKNVPSLDPFKLLLIFDNNLECLRKQLDRVLLSTYKPDFN